MINTSLKKYLLRIATLLIGGVLITNNISAKNIVTPIDLTLKIQDKSGLNIQNVIIKNSADNIIGITDENGAAKLKVKEIDFLLIEKEGYDSKRISATDLKNNGVVSLNPCLKYDSNNDKIVVPRGEVSKRYTSGDYFVITGEELSKYPTTDLRNALVGLIPGLDVTELDGSTGTSSEEMTGNYEATTKVKLRGRGGQSPLWIIDEVPIDISEMQLSPQEIESITFVKDAISKSVYGPSGANGIIYVKTKQGNNEERYVDIDVESGVSAVDRFPEFVDGVEYAQLNNLARQNSGLAPLYSTEDIEKFALNDPYSLTHPNINFKNMLLKNVKPFAKMNISSKGGNKVIQYFANINYVHEGDIYDLGSTSAYDRINARANLNIKVNDFMKFRTNLFAGLSLRNSPNYGGTENLQEFTSVMDDITRISPIAFPVYAYNDNEVDFNRYAVSSVFGSNPIGNLVDNGYYNEKGRTGSGSFTLDIDFSKWIKGLSSHTTAAFNIMNMVRMGKANQYASYVVTPNADRTDVTIELKQLSSQMSDQKKFHDYYWQRYVGSQRFNYNNIFNDRHAIDLNLNYYLSKMTRRGITNPYCQQGASFTAMYTFDKRYTIDGAITIDGTQAIISNNQYVFSPSLGASWIILDKNLDKTDGFIDFLKLRAEWGNIAVETSRTSAQYLYQDSWSLGGDSNFGPHSTGRWQGNNQETGVHIANKRRTGNSDLDWERENDITAGFDIAMFDNRFTGALSYYNIKRYNTIVPSDDLYPLITGLPVAPKINYGSTRYNGMELDFNYKDHVGDFRYLIGVNLTYQNSKILKKCEPEYRYAYQSHVGNAADAYYGLEYIGRFGTDEETKKVPQIFDEELHAGDLKYVDQNQDGIVDDNDQKAIGHTLPRIYYGLKLDLGYKDWDLYILGNGRAAYDIALTNRYFQNGWGDNTYSAFVRDNMNSDYPRLTYYKVNNNFKSSSFWLRNGNFFKIQNIQLSYNVPYKVLSRCGIQRAKVYVAGANLLTVSKIKDVDPEAINSGISVYPLYRTFTLGFKLSF